MCLRTAEVHFIWFAESIGSGSVSFQALPTEPTCLSHNGAKAYSLIHAKSNEGTGCLRQAICSGEFEECERCPSSAHSVSVDLSSSQHIILIIQSSAAPPWLDYKGYVQSFAGNIFMTAFSKPHGLPPEEFSSSPFDGDLDVSTFSAFFCAAISKEAEALQAECNEHDLYKVQMPRAGQDPREATYLLHVPGLRETSLRIEVGDIVQIRQIRLDRFGNMIPQFAFRDKLGQPLPHAVTRRYDAVVWSIDRLREIVTLRVDSLHQSSPFFNARFIVQSDRMEALRRAVIGAQEQMSSNGEGNEWMRSM